MFVKTVTDYLKEKSSSTILLSFIVFYVLCNCRWIFSSLFVDQALIVDKYNLLKGEYIYEYFIELHPDSFWFYFCSLMPFLLTYLYIWWVPKFVINPAFKRQLKYKNERRCILLTEENKISVLRSELLKNESINTDAMIKLEDKKNKLNEKNPDVLLKDEYDLFKNNKEWIFALLTLQDVVYKNYGDISSRDPKIIMLLDVNGLTVLEDDIHGTISITEKGKFFLKKAMEENVL